jgi:hypothetical protein
MIPQCENIVALMQQYHKKVWLYIHEMIGFKN